MRIPNIVGVAANILRMTENIFNDNYKLFLSIHIIVLLYAGYC